MGFFAKQFVLFSAIQSGYYFISIVAIIVSVISASYYLKIVRTLFTNPSEVNNNLINDNDSLTLQAEGANNSSNRTQYSEYTISSIHSFLISSLSLFILLLSIIELLLLDKKKNILLLINLIIYLYL